MRDGSLAALVVLGAFHGLNPGMGWLFAVARGVQERSRALLLQSLPAIAAGHAASVGVVALVVTVTGSVLTTRIVAIGGGVVLVGFGLWQLLSKRHFRWVGMRMSLWQLASWSFLMSSVHGAGLMLVPLLTSTPPPAGHDHGLASGPAGAAVFVTCVHTLAMLTVAGVIAIVAYHVMGAAVLHRRWFNLDRLWAFALICAGTITVLTAA